MIWIQKTLALTPKTRGFHLVTGEVLEQLPELAQVKTGLVHFFLQHTSASLTLNENADPDVRRDMEVHFNHTVPDGSPLFIHTCEGPDDMPAHIKSSVLGNELTVPVASGRLVLGTWQGLYLGEHRNHGGSRRIVVTISGTAND